MDKRNKLWRREQQNRLFKARIILYAAYGQGIIDIIRKDGCLNEHPYWFELAREKWVQVYKTTDTPCSCWMCRGEQYNCRECQKETLRIIKESED